MVSSRQPVQDILLPKTVYEQRREQMSQRIEAMKRFVFDDTRCRVMTMLEYFGEEAHPCGTCDVCRAEKARKEAHSRDNARKAAANAAMVEQAVEYYRVHYEEVGSHQCSLFPGVRQMMDTLKDAGLYMATATCKPVEVVTPILKEQGLFDYFDRIGGASMDESVDNKTDVIRLVLQDPRLAGKRILMVGDRQDDMQGAVNNQLPAAAVLYGYGSREEMEPWNPVLLAQNCEELTQYILG